MASIGRSQRAAASTKVASRTLEQLEAAGRLSRQPAATTGLAIYMLLDFIRLVQSDSRREEEEEEARSWHRAWTSTFLKTTMIDAGWCQQQMAWVIQTATGFQRANYVGSLLSLLVL
jgi:hypothetical protein